MINLRRIQNMRCVQGLAPLLALSLLTLSCDDDSGAQMGQTPPPAQAGEMISAGATALTCTDETGSEVTQGAPCECNGVIMCVGGTPICQGQTAKNSCGGCAPLSAEPGQACGECGLGAWACEGEESVTCSGEVGRNVCGGCGVIVGEVDTPCGECGTLACEGPDELICFERPQNACGGCEPLEERLGEACGTCGVWACGPRGSAVCEERDPGICQVTRLILMGDTGEANMAQYQVSAGAQARCDRAGGCDGFVMLGDNIYDTGAESAMDQQLTDKIDLPYANLKKGPPPAPGEPDDRPRMPIYVSLGNHDLGGAGLNSPQIQHYLDYALVNDWFYYPDEFWELQIGHVHLISLHTNPLAYSFPDGLYLPQGELIDQVVRGSTATWRLAFGHHPYRSEGQHGNAGAYEGLEIDMEVFGFDVSGNGFREWIDTYVCNQVDFYVSGHDHNRQWLAPVPLIPNLPAGAGTEVCNTQFAVSGAGAKTKDFEGRGNDLEFGEDQREGFLMMTFHHDRVEAEFCDADGNTEWSKVIMR